MASPSGDRREAVRAASTAQVTRWEQQLAAQLDALWDRQEAVILTRLQGTRARKHTRHWAYDVAPARQVKALDVGYVVDSARWVLQGVNVARDLLQRLYEEVIVRVLRSLGWVLADGEVARLARRAAAEDTQGSGAGAAAAVAAAAALAGGDDSPTVAPAATVAAVAGGRLSAEAAHAAGEAAAATARIIAALALAAVPLAGAGGPVTAPAGGGGSDGPTPPVPPAPGGAGGRRDRPEPSGTPSPVVPTPAVENRQGPVVPPDVVAVHVQQRLETIAAGVAAAADEIAEVIETAEAEQAPMPEIVERVRDRYAGRRKIWTDQIVASNIVAAMNESSLIAATAAGVTHKQWLSSHDGRVRDTHVVVDGQIQPMDEPFSLDGGAALLAYPGDPTGPIRETIRCRCTLLFPMPSLQPVYDPAAFGKALPVYASATKELLPA